MVSTSDPNSASPELPWEQDFGQNLRRLRSSAGMSQYALAQELRTRNLPFHQQLIDRIERGQRPVRLNEAVVIAHYFGKDLTSMFDAGLQPESGREHRDRVLRRAADEGTSAIRKLHDLSLALGAERVRATKVEKSLAKLVAQDEASAAEHSLAIAITRYVSAVWQSIERTTSRVDDIYDDQVARNERLATWLFAEDHDEQRLD